MCRFAGRMAQGAVGNCAGAERCAGHGAIALTTDNGQLYGKAHGYWIRFVDIYIYSSIGSVHVFLNATYSPFLFSVKLSKVVLLLYFVFLNHSIRTNPQF